MMRDMMMTAGKTSLQKTVQVFLIGMKLMLKLSKKIEKENRDHAERVAVHKGEESDRSYSLALCHNQSSEDIEDAENFNLGENNNIVKHLNNEDDTVVGDDNGDNNMIGRVDEVVAPVIENSAPHGRMEIGSSSNSRVVYRDVMTVS